jgi:hypothetical protein
VVAVNKAVAAASRVPVSRGEAGAAVSKEEALAIRVNRAALGKKAAARAVVAIDDR